MLTRRLFAKAAVAVVVFATFMGAAATVASADDDGWGGVVCDPSQTDCTVSAGTSPTPPSGGNGGGSGGTRQCIDLDGIDRPCYLDGIGWFGFDKCFYGPIELQLTPETIAALGGQPPGPGVWYSRSCRPYAGQSVASANISVVYLATAPAPVAELVARHAVSHLVLPRLSASVNPSGLQLVNLPTWLSVPATSWGSRSATASVPGVSVTATATATKVVFKMGDGHTVTCHSRGTDWHTGLDPLASSPDCGYTYRTPGENLTIRASVSWSISWSGAGSSGTLPDLVTTTSIPVRVGESQTVVTH